LFETNRQIKVSESVGDFINRSIEFKSKYEMFERMGEFVNRFVEFITESKVCDGRGEMFHWLKCHPKVR
jgi:hypothetical protein